MATTTPRQSLPVMQSTDDPDIPTDINALAVAIEKRLFGVYNSVSDRDTRNTAPEEGQVAYLKDLNKAYVYDGAIWQQLYPSSGLPTFYTDTVAPSNGTGANGDIYFQV